MIGCKYSKCCSERYFKNTAGGSDREGHCKRNKGIRTVSEIYLSVYWTKLSEDAINKSCQCGVEHGAADGKLAGGNSDKMKL